MKKIIKILTLLLACGVLTVNAETIDMNGEYFKDDVLYKSGDTYVNMSLINATYALFTTQYGYMYYTTYNPMTVTYQSTPISNSGYYRFYTDIYADNPVALFGIEDYTETDFIIPKLYGRNVIWKHQQVAPTTNTRSYIFKSRLAAADNIPNNKKDVFVPMVMDLNFEIKCDNENVNYGESTTCALYYSFMPISNFDMPFILDLKLESDKYNISNINVNKLSSFKINDTSISGSVYDYSKKITSIADLGFNSEEEFEKHIDEYIQAEKMCIYRLDDSSSTTYPTVKDALGLPKITIDDDDDCYYLPKYTYKIATFNITPKENANVDGEIKVLNSKLGYINLDSENETVYNTNNEASNIVPIIANQVKGEEEITENPKTGLNNYISLVVLAGMLLISIGYLSKYNKFKKIK